MEADAERQAKNKKLKPTKKTIKKNKMSQEIKIKGAKLSKIGYKKYLQDK